MHLKRFTRCAAALILSLTAAAQSPTVLTIGAQPVRSGVKRFGINLSGQTYWDSGQLLRNLVSRNPGFEGGEWRTILHCKQAFRDTCVDANPWTTWKDGFLDGAHFEVLSGPAAGATGTVVHTVAAKDREGVRLALTEASANGHDLHDGDFLSVQMAKPGNPDAGWWIDRKNGAAIFPETHDLSPHTPGRQALRVNATGAGRHVSVGSYFDTFKDRSFVQLRGAYRLTFRAKPISPGAKLHISLERLDQAHGRTVFLEKDMQLRPGWNDYDLPMTAHEARSAVGNLYLNLAVDEAELLLDDISLQAVPTRANTTAFRDEVVAALRDLHPGVLRYMDNGPSFGSSLDSLLAPEFARLRTGYSTQSTLQEDVAIGLEPFLELCAAVGAEPWITLPPALTTTEARELIDFLDGPATSPYGARRTALGRPQPWADAFPLIHLELGNEQWNAQSFSGGAISDPGAYGQRAAHIFAAMRSAPGFRRDRYDLVMGTWAANPWWTGEELKAAGTSAMGAPDSTAIAPYLFSDFKLPEGTQKLDFETTFGAMLAQPEQIDSRPSGSIAQQRDTVRAAPHPTRLEVYEVNLGTMIGTAPQFAVDQTAPSLGAGLAVADHMLLLLRDLGVDTQCLFALPEYQNGFSNLKAPHETTPLWGAVVDMGGATDLRRPTYLALEQMNQAILPNLLPVHLSGPNPTWNQPKNLTDNIELHDAHLLQAFAFAEGKQHSLILLNLSRDRALPVAFAGSNAPTARPGHPVERTVLNAASITANNERSEQVRLARSSLTATPQGFVEKLPAHSMTTLRWSVP